MLHDYTFRQTTSDTRYWHCVKKSSSNCHARIRFDHSGNLKVYQRVHNHTPDRHEVLGETFSKPENPVGDPNSEKGKPILTLDGYTYFGSTKRGRRSYWRCTSSSEFGCQATVVTVGDTIKIGSSPHVHPPPEQIVSRK